MTEPRLDDLDAGGDRAIKCRNPTFEAVWFYCLDEDGDLLVHHSRYGFAPHGEQSKRQARMSIEADAVDARLVSRREVEILVDRVEDDPDRARADGGSDR